MLVAIGNVGIQTLKHKTNILKTTIDTHNTMHTPRRENVLGNTRGMHKFRGDLESGWSGKGQRRGKDSDHDPGGKKTRNSSCFSHNVIQTKVGVNCISREQMMVVIIWKWKNRPDNSAQLHIKLLLESWQYITTKLSQKPKSACFFLSRRLPRKNIPISLLLPDLCDPVDYVKALALLSCLKLE